MNHHHHHHHHHSLPRLTWQLTLITTVIMACAPSSSAIYLHSSIFPRHDQGYGYRNYYAKRDFPHEDQGQGYHDYHAKRIFPTQELGQGYRDYYAKGIVSVDDQGHGYRDYRAKRIVPVDDQGHGYRDYRAKRIVPVDDQGYGYRDYRAKRIVPVDDQGYGYRDYRAKRIVPVDDQGHGYRDYRAKRIFPTEDQGQGYRDFFAKRIFPTEDQGQGYRDFFAKRIFPTEDQGQGYRDFFAKRIFPTEDQGHGYRNYRSKRLPLDSSSACNSCILTYDPDHCIRCWHSKSAVVPIYAKRGGDGAPDAGSGQYGDGKNEYSGSLELGDRSLDLEANNPDMHEDKRGNFSRVARDYGLDPREPFFRHQRSSVCGCCYLSRLSNQRCCQMCQMVAKRSGTPLMTSEGESDAESDLPSKRAYMANPDCFCCLRSGGDACCSRCFAK